MEKIIFIGSSWVFAKYIPLACHLLGYQPVFLGDLNFYSDEVREVIEQCEHYDVEINSVDAMYNLIKEKKIDKIAGITTSADTKLRNAILIAERLKVKGPDRAILKITNKEQVTQMVPEYSPEGIGFKKGSVPTEKIQKLLLKYPVLVLKPAYGSGAANVTKLQTPEQVSNIQSYLDNLKENDWVVQQAIDGELYSIEGYCLNGHSHILGFNLRDRIQMTEMSSHFPVEQIMSNHIREKSLEALDLLIKRSEYKNGYFHCEFLSDGEQVYLIDANFGRIGGGAIIEMIAKSFDDVPEKIAAHIISIGIFGKEPKGIDPYTNSPKSTLSISFGLENAGEYKKVIMPKTLSRYYTAVAKENTKIEAIGKDDYSWVGILTGTYDNVLKDIKKIKIQTNQGIFPAKYYVRTNLVNTAIAK